MASLKNVTSILILVCSLILILECTPSVEGYPSIRKRYDLDFIQICLNNCSQCKKMFGNYFQGEACAESCLKLEGKVIPDCEDIGSIAPFVKTFE